MRLHGLKSTRNTLRIMKQMEEYVTSFRDGENIYYLNTNGRARVNCNKVRKKTPYVVHYLIRNDLYLALNAPATWRTEVRITSKGKTKEDTVTIQPDAIFERNKRLFIVEVDNLQSMQNNSSKIKTYRILLQRKAFGETTPIFIWVTNNEYRRKRLLELNKGLECTVYTQGSLK